MTMNAIETPPDTFHWLGEINKASAVMVVEQAIVPAALGATIAATIAKVIAAGNQPHAARPGDYLLLETALIEAGGPDVTRVHAGRSRQDIGATLGCLFLRDDLLAVLDALNAARDALLTLAEAHTDAIIPAYTWGVQAQPTTFGHWLSAHAAALNRAAEPFLSNLRPRQSLPPGRGCAWHLEFSRQSSPPCRTARL